MISTPDLYTYVHAGTHVHARAHTHKHTPLMNLRMLRNEHVASGAYFSPLHMLWEDARHGISHTSSAITASCNFVTFCNFRNVCTDQPLRLVTLEMCAQINLFDLFWRHYHKNQHKSIHKSTP